MDKESKKLYYSMGEVCEMFCVAPSLIRHWEGYFSVIKPVRNKKGNRLFTPADIENFKIIYHLVKERGMTLEGARRAMNDNREEHLCSAELLERLYSIRSLLLEVREELKDDDRVINCEDVKPQRLSFDIPCEQVELQLSPEEQGVDGEVRGEPKPMSQRHIGRTPDAESKELFAFYEQTLF
ncbi:MAG: MerR family transcriptional regulator [Rikenellaceae bacterium]